ncbi:MAG: glycoside hydrolase family 73 protein [Bacteroidota bacterium]
MGKNKLYAEEELLHRFRFSEASSRTKNADSLPSAHLGNAGRERLNNPASVKSNGLNRKWTTLRYIWHTCTTAAFNKAAFLKVGFLVGAGYFALYNDGPTAAFISGPVSAIDWNTSNDEVKEEQIAELPKVKSKARRPAEQSETQLGLLADGSNERTAEEKPSKSKLQKTPPETKKVLKKPVNDAAPVRIESLRGDQTAAYIKKFSAVARQEMARYGIPASISLAQGIIESRAGTSTLAVRNNNHFGMKCFSRNCKKGHCTNHSDDSHKDFFLNFKDPKLSWRAHSILLSGGRYARLKKHGKDYKKWAYGLKTMGYATDRTYADKLISTIERYGLQQYDY